MIIATEVTPLVIAKKQIEASELNFRQLAELMPEKISNTDTNGEVFYYNQRWVDYTGFSIAELLNNGWSTLVPPDKLAEISQKWTHSLETGEFFEHEIQILDKNGDYKWHLCRSTAVKDENGKITKWFGVATEIQEQIDYQIALENAKNNAELKTKIAEDAMKAKQQFLSNMSHEIRTPMNAIVGFTNVVLKTELDDKQKEYLNAIKISGDALIELINDILDLAKVDSGKMVFRQTPFNLSDSIANMVQLFEIKFKEKNLELIKELDGNIPQIIEGDSIRLRQVILNLLSNAVKFTEKGKITLQISMVNEDENSINIEFNLTDTGIGIQADKLNDVFNNFEQVHVNAKSFYGGTGLGLAIVKQLVEAQGGTITVKSKLNKGTKFSFTLNFKKTAIKSEQDTIIEDETKTGEIKVLVVEDVALNQLLIKIILMDFGFELDVVDNGKLAIEQLQDNKYDIILMDLQMPEMDGFETTTYIRKEMKSKIPIIALTADVTTADFEKCVAVGMNDYISKPIDEKLLYSKMMKALKKSSK